ncbi:hypothetical protein M426DRAFT_71669 [Hypoxylon sp. CI-4A]|nr:hypothetical protein M426DRAFT_71669 [Hypoxylon sp. CI-4A]
MVSHNAYLAYKRYSNYLVYWLIHTSNRISKSLAAAGSPDTALLVNKDGNLQVTSLIPMSKFIVEHGDPVPTIVFRLLKEVIRTRSAANAMFEQAVSDKPDPELERSNEQHKYFIGVLKEVFTVLGGEEWESTRRTSENENEGNDLSEEVIEEFIFSNKFNPLQEPADDSNDEQKKTHGKGKKGKKGKEKRPKKETIPPESDLNSVPIESYRIIHGGDIVTEYRIAVFALSLEWAELRPYVQTLWGEVAFNKANSAVAGCLSNIAIAKARRTEAALFVDFPPGHDNFETVMMTLTKGDPEGATYKTCWMDHANGGKIVEVPIDALEVHMIYTYRALLEFITDFQKTRSGKPTKTMAKRLRNWSPDFDPGVHSKEECLKWRRCYTINWLYDLVSLYSYPIFKWNDEHSGLGPTYKPETTDWSLMGPWGEKRRLFGLNEFAATISTLAWRKYGDIKELQQKILPQLVLQLQFIVDSFTVTRGWGFSLTKGEYFVRPTADYNPLLDIDQFLKGDHDATGDEDEGFNRAADLLSGFLQYFSQLNGNENYYKPEITLIQAVKHDYDWLGRSPIKDGYTHMQRSRFADTNPNGLWEYCPLLCGVGLAEAPELAHLTTITVWDYITEPLLVVHIHNMLVQKGYLKKPISLLNGLEKVFRTTFFVDGIVPKENFAEVLVDRVWRSARRALRNRSGRAPKRQARTEVDRFGLMSMEDNLYFNEHCKTTLMLYREANWNLDNVPEGELTPKSELGKLRIAQTKVVTDPETGKKKLADTELVRRSLKLGYSMEELLKIQGSFHRKPNPIAEAAKAREKEAFDTKVNKEGLPTVPMPELKKRRGQWQPSSSDGTRPNFEIDDLEFRYMIKRDVMADICGAGLALSGINLTRTTTWMFRWFMAVTQKLEDQENEAYRHMTRTDPMWRFNKNAGLAALALREQDEQCLRIMADLLDSGGQEYDSYMYW